MSQKPDPDSFPFKAHIISAVRKLHVLYKVLEYLAEAALSAVRAIAALCVYLYMWWHLTIIIFVLIERCRIPFINFVEPTQGSTQVMEILSIPEEGWWSATTIVSLILAYFISEMISRFIRRLCRKVRK